MARTKTSLQSIPQHAQKVFSGELFDVYQWQQELFDGSHATFEKLRRSDGVGVVAVTPEKQILLLRQQQPAMDPFISLVGGRVDPGETAEQTARRELLEETGCVAREIVPWFSLQPFEKIEWTISFFIARDCVVKHKQSLDAGEKIEVHAHTYEEFFETVQHNDFRDTEVAFRVIAAQLDSKKAAQLRNFILG